MNLDIGFAEIIEWLVVGLAGLVTFFIKRELKEIHDAIETTNRERKESIILLQSEINQLSTRVYATEKNIEINDKRDSDYRALIDEKFKSIDDKLSLILEKFIK